MSWSLHPLAWQCKRLASGGIELIKSLPSLMCFKRIYSILWHQTSRFPGRSFPFVSPPRMFELITAKLHTLGLLVWMHTNKNTHKKQQPVKAFAPLDSHFWIKTLQSAAIVRRKRRIPTPLKRLETLSPARKRVQTAPQMICRDKRFFSQPRLACLLPLISCFLYHTEARRLMGPSYATACSCALFFSFPHKSLPVLNLRRLKLSGCPTPAERQGSGCCYC